MPPLETSVLRGRRCPASRSRRAGAWRPPRWPVIEDHGRTHALAAIAVDGGDIGAADAVVLEPLVKRRHARLAHPAFDQFADAVIDHRGGDAGPQSEAIGQIGGDVVFAAGDVDLDRAGLAERHHAGIEPVYQRPQGEEIQLMRSGLDGQIVHVSRRGRSHFRRTKIGTVPSLFKFIFSAVPREQYPPGGGNRQDPHRPKSRKRSRGTVRVTPPKGTGPCFRPRASWPTQQRLAEKWTSPRPGREQSRKPLTGTPGRAA